MRLGRRPLKRLTLGASLAAMTLAAGASQAGAAVTLGQLAPSPVSNNCGADIDQLQPTVTSGNAYVVPATGGITSWTVTSWSINASSNAQMVIFKVFRNVSGLDYMVVGHDGPRSLTPSTVNTFSSLNIPVKPGDVLGNNAVAGPNWGCMFPQPGETWLYYGGNLGDGQQATFSTNTGFRLNVTAVVEPDCDNDGLGDETQDTNLSSCPPSTTPTGPAPTLPGGAPATCRGVPATIVGTEGSDVRTGSHGQDVIVGLGGNDTLSGLAGNDLICGGKGKDKLDGGAGNDQLSGQKGNDKLYGRKGNDKLSGKAGTDLLKGGPGKDKLKGGAGKDVQIQ